MTATPPYSYNRYLAWHALHGGNYPQAGPLLLEGVVAYLAFEAEQMPVSCYPDDVNNCQQDEESTTDAP